MHCKALGGLLANVLAGTGGGAERGMLGLDFQCLLDQPVVCKVGNDRRRLLKVKVVVLLNFSGQRGVALGRGYGGEEVEFGGHNGGNE